MIELQGTEKAAQTRARNKGNGYVGLTQLRRFFRAKAGACKAFRKVRNLDPQNPAHVQRMINHLEWVETFGALEPFEARVLAHYRGDRIPMPPSVGGMTIRVGTNAPVEKAIRRAA